MIEYQSTKIIELGSCAFRQWRADHSHCHFIHGYRLIAKFYFGCTTLDDKNWVVDFGGLKELKHVLEKQFDHTFCVAGDDPLLSKFEELHNLGALDLRVMQNGVGIERTAEWCLQTADELIRKQSNNRCWVDRVEVWEHEKNSAIVAVKHGCKGACNKSETISTTIQPNIEQATVVNAGICITPDGKAVGTEVSAGGQIENTPLKDTITGAPLRTKKSIGFSNLFGGTSWGV